MVSPDQARELVEHFGSHRAAADAIGVHNTTITYWLAPDRKRAAERDRYDRFNGRQYNHRLLQIRRHKALKRRAQRAARGGLDGTNR